ncbi:MAG TPA: hypothetical protein EYQ00_04170, partial [Dehalococcoidia bacterium]|nr:hypothetical protein [Dehalococcoidia bacterium]
MAVEVDVDVHPKDAVVCVNIHVAEDKLEHVDVDVTGVRGTEEGGTIGDKGGIGGKEDTSEAVATDLTEMLDDEEVLKA